jgi:lysyl-tRNA synthetase class 2
VSKRESSNKLVFYDVLQNGKTLQAVASMRNVDGDTTLFGASNAAINRGDIVRKPCVRMNTG